MHLVISLLISQSHEDRQGQGMVKQLRKRWEVNAASPDLSLEQKGVKSKPWDRNRLLKLGFAGAVVKSATNPVYLHSSFNMHSKIASSSNICTFLGAASSSEPPISQVTSPEAEDGRMARSLSFTNKGMKLRERKKKLPALEPCSSFCFC